MATISVYETANGRRYRVRYRKPDRTQTDKRGFKTKREAELFASSVEVAKARGEFIDATAARATIGVLGAEWLATQTHLKPSTARSIESAWRVHVEPVWGARAVADVRHSEVQGWVTRLAKTKALQRLSGRMGFFRRSFNEPRRTVESQPLLHVG